MSSLSPQQFPAGPNPFLLLVGGIDKGLSMLDENRRRKIKTAYLASRQRSGIYDEAMTAHKAHYKTISTPEYTNAPVPGYRVQKPITPESTGAPMPGELAKKTAIHPITGARVPRTPVKPRGKKPTPPGTKPKRK